MRAFASSSRPRGLSAATPHGRGRLKAGEAGGAALRLRAGGFRRRAAESRRRISATAAGATPKPTHAGSRALCRASLAGEVGERARAVDGRAVRAVAGLGGGATRERTRPPAAAVCGRRSWPAPSGARTATACRQKISATVVSAATKNRCCFSPQARAVTLRVVGKGWRALRHGQGSCARFSPSFV